MSVIRIGIMPQEKIRERTLAIAKGELKPKRTDPKIWFPSMKALGEVLSDHNRQLIHLIAEYKPESIQELADLSGRAPSNVSRTLKTMSLYGLVSLEPVGKHRKRPVAKATEFLIHAAA